MTSREERAHANLRDANDLGYTHPWPLIVLLASAIVMALLTIAAAVEALLDTHR